MDPSSLFISGPSLLSTEVLCVALELRHTVRHLVRFAVLTRRHAPNNSHNPNSAACQAMPHLGAARIIIIARDLYGLRSHQCITIRATRYGLSTERRTTKR